MGKIERTDNAFPRTTRAASEPPCSSPKLTQREMTIELERLAIWFPRPDMDARKWQELFRTCWTDLQHLTIEQLREACRRYRTRAESRFFPIPGQLLAMVESDRSGRRGHPPADGADAPLPGRLTPESAEEIRRRLGFGFRPETADEPVTRPYTTVELQRLRELKQKREEALERLVRQKAGGQAA